MLTHNKAVDQKISPTDVGSSIRKVNLAAHLFKFECLNVILSTGKHLSIEIDGRQPDTDEENQLDCIGVCIGE